jgi:hypothetical protein
MNADTLLSRLEKVRGSGGQWTACCPAHDDRGPSLRVKEGDDGRVLLHCFAGCSIDEIVGALGYSLSDIMPEQRPLPMPRRSIPAPEVLEAMTVNAMVVAICAADIAKGRQLSPEEKDKLFAIAGEFQQAIEFCGATRMRDEQLRGVARGAGDR